MIPTFRFDQAQLTSELDRLPPDLRVIFSASCAERLLPAYIASSGLTETGDPEMLARILARLWEDIDGNRMTESELQSSTDICMGLIPQDYHDPWFVEQASAEDASAALVYALTCRQNGNSREAMWSAQRACSAVDHFIVNRENIDLKPVGAVEQALAHPLIQAELARQHRDIDELLGAAGEDVKQVAAKFRERAKAEAKIFFGAPS